MILDASIVDTAGAVPLDLMAAGVEPDDLAPPLAYEDAVKAFPPELHAIPSTASLSAYAQGAPPLIHMGYSTIRIRAGEKRPYGNEWQKYCRSPATPAEVAKWMRGPYGLGIATGAIVYRDGKRYQIVGIDIDLVCDELEQARSAIPPSSMEKLGRTG